MVYRRLVMTVLKRINSFFKGVLSSQYILKYTPAKYVDRFYGTFALYTSELDVSWWRPKALLMKLENTGNGFKIHHRPGNVSSSFKSFELNYADVEYLLILLKQEQKIRGNTTHKQGKYYEI